MQESPGKKPDWRSKKFIFKEVIEQGVKNDSFKHFTIGFAEANQSIIFN